MFSSMTSSTSSKPLSSQARSQPSTDPYKSLNGKETSVHGSKTALVASEPWKTKGRTEVKGGGIVQEDIELGVVPRDAIGVTRDVHVSRMAAK